MMHHGATTTRAPRPRGRMLAALAIVAMLYIALDELVLALVGTGLGIAAVGEIAAPRASEIAAVSEASAAGEAKLTPRHRVAAFALGRCIGSSARALSVASLESDRSSIRSNSAKLLATERWDELLGVAPAPFLEPRGLVEALALSELIERDTTGLAARIEAHTTERHRHLYLAGAQLGVYELDVGARPASIDPPGAIPEIARHLSLAGVPRTLWEPLTKAPPGESAQQRFDEFERRMQRLQAALESPTWPPT